MLAVASLVLGFAGPLRVARVPPVSVVAYASMAKKVDESESGSFVQTEMRGAAMALHTRQQAPREGKAEAKKVEQRPVQSWQPGRAEYLQFLVDSKHVYSALEEIVAAEPKFATFRKSGLERAEPLAKDIAWFEEQGVAAPAVAPQGATYATMLREMVASGELEAFVCHFYNFYFAHTAGGRMIGKRMADLLLEGRTLEFYQWEVNRPANTQTPARQRAAPANTTTRTSATHLHTP